MNDPMRAAVQAEVLEVLASVLKFDPKTFQGDLSLAESGVDSLGLVESLFVIEERFNVSLPYNANEQDGGTDSLQSLGQLLDQVVDLVLAQRADSPAGKSPDPVLA